MYDIWPKRAFLRAIGGNGNASKFNPSLPKDVINCMFKMVLQLIGLSAKQHFFALYCQYSLIAKRNIDLINFADNISRISLEVLKGIHFSHFTMSFIARYEQRN